MKGCDRCGHAKKLHVLRGNQPGNLLCVAFVKQSGGTRACLCPKYIQPGGKP